MNLPITYTYLLICLLHPPSTPPPPFNQANDIYLHLYYELWENRYIGIFKQFSFIMVTGISALVATDTIHNLASFLKLLTDRVIPTFFLVECLAS